ncbi:MAG: hypothetical protein HQ582_22025 [Planctomycetes bacterium]|nr:hypothetical protein [Planctomycetota bacterium]
MRAEPFWERAYQDLETSTFGKPSKEFHDLIRLLPSRARVLDLGCGEGRNALFLAENGIERKATSLKTNILVGPDTGIPSTSSWRANRQQTTGPTARRSRGAECVRLRL